MHGENQHIERRLRRILAERLRPAIAAERIPCAASAFATPERQLPFAAATASRFAPLPVGTPWGPPFSTLWIRIDGALPAAWASARTELWIDLGFDDAAPGFQAEGLAYDADGTVLKGVAPRNSWIPIRTGAPALPVYVEAAANPAIGTDRPGSAALGDPAQRGDAPLYRFGGADLVRVDEEIAALVADLEVLGGLAGELFDTDPWRHEILAGCARALDACDPADPAPGAARAREELAPLFARRGRATTHRVSAVGHAHIDSAWLWPLAETRRKCARTVANVLALAEERPELVFAFSQAQQYAWVKEDHPALYARLHAAVAAGRVEPVGGMWVESDTNLPAGESLARQLLYGQRFFLEEFGRVCTEVWLPDCFGYSPALPQLMRLAGASAFLTQKLSWNDTNRFPHHSFLWEGLDGTRIFTHFPPADTYNGEVTAAELCRAVRSFADKGGASRSLLPFGYGDGGGGPTREMCARAERFADLEGAPQVVIESPAAFFAAAAGERADAPIWVGELYLELHRGTFTSQARLKAAHRRCEHLLREVELWAATAAWTTATPYPRAALEAAWKTLLLRQFHDILPGSSIAEVNEEAVGVLETLADELDERAGALVQALAGAGERALVANPRPQRSAACPAGALAPEHPPEGAPVRAAPGADGALVLDNGLLRVTIDSAGLLTSLIDGAAGRELIPPDTRGNVLQLHPDFPADWDAWDIDRSARRAGVELVTGTPPRLECSDDEAVVRVARQHGRSAFRQEVRLRRGERQLHLSVEIDWHDVERLVKLALPLDLMTTAETAEVAFGHVVRPIHENTSWDAARFERPAHRFVHFSEGDYGVTCTNNATYGHDTARPARRNGGTTTVLRWSLLRGPRFPDPRADEGTHRFSFSIVPGTDLTGAVAAAWAENSPLRHLRGAAPVAPLIVIDHPAVVPTALKCAEDDSGDLIVRCVESRGGRAEATLRCATDIAAAARTDLLERATEQLALEEDNRSVHLRLRPFEVLTIRLTRRSPDPAAREP